MSVLDGWVLGPDDGSLVVGCYEGDPCCMWLAIDGEVVTVNFGPDVGNGTVMPMWCAWLDVNDHPEVPELLAGMGLGEPRRRFGGEVTMSAGFVEYPLWRFGPQALEEAGAIGMGRVEEGWREGFAAARDEVCGGGFDLAAEMAGVRDAAATDRSTSRGRDGGRECR